MERDPSTKALFANVNVDDVHSPEFGAHVLRVATAITYTIEAVQDENLVEQITSHLAAQHAARNGVKVEHFDFLREIMKEDMRVWSTNFNEDAWDNCVDPILKAVSARLT
ncbi:Extracellular globin-2C [Lamellibrachia satsuma]|nr:Extracellular globin-2C [Lamellibrachia satsuma]